MKKQKIVLVMSPLNNSGKTRVVVDNLLSLVLPKADIVQIESVDDYKRIKGAIHLPSHKVTDMADIAAMATNSLIVDAGSSIKKTLVSALKKQKGLLEDFTHIVIPVTSDSRVLTATRTMVADLLESGVKPSTIKPVLNRLTDMEQEYPEDYFDTFIEDLAGVGVKCDINSFISESELFTEMDDFSMNIIDVMNDGTNYKKLRIAEVNPAKKLQYRRKETMKALQDGVAEELIRAAKYLAVA